MRTTEKVLISSITTMRIGGVAKYVVEVEQPNEIVEAVEFAEFYRLPIFILGGGANTIGRDEGFNGVILINRMRGVTLTETPEGFRLKAMGGEVWDEIVRVACERGLTGIEALSKIPGLVGAAPVQNIGAYGQEIADTLESIEVLDLATKTLKTLKKEDLGFSYRKSLLNTTARGRYFVISVTLLLKKGQMSKPFYNSIETYAADKGLTDFSPMGIREIVSAIRADKLPDPKFKASAGSFFKNVYLSEEETEKAKDKGLPVYEGKDGRKINAGWLIEKAGFSGKVLHGFRVNEKAALVLINESATTYAELAAARAEIVGGVYDKFGFWLEQEPVEIA